MGASCSGSNCWWHNGRYFSCSFGGNVISGIATGALGGALAISGAGRAAQIVGSAALSAINNTVTQLTSKPIASFSINELITETASGALAGVLGGEGASITNAKSIMGYGKQAIKQIKGNIKHGKSVFKPIKNYLSRAQLKVTSRFLKHLQNRLHFRLFIQMEEIFISSSSEMGELNEIHDGIYFDYWQ